MNIFSGAVLLTLALVFRGCVAVTPASFDRGTSLVVEQRLSDEDWPARYPDPVDALMTAVSQRDHDSRMPDAVQNQMSRLVGFFSNRLEHQRLGRGIVCELPAPEDSLSRQILYITNRLPKERLEASFEKPRPTQVERDQLLRWHFQLRMPTRPTPRGLIVHLTSIGDRRFERSVSDTLRSRGWAVLQVVPGRIIVPFLHETVPGQGRRVVDAAEVASVMDDYAADYAYAVEGVLDYLSDSMPQIVQQPLVMTGYSAGSLALPTIAARLDGRVDAAVFVGGGANAASILVNGKITNVVDVIRKAGDAHILPELRAMPEAYLKESKFDPYHTAPYLTGIPVLFIQGTLDQIVPRENGDLLYERLNHPERWSFPLGHIPLFWILPTQSSRIADWVESAVEQRSVALSR